MAQGRWEEARAALAGAVAADSLHAETRFRLARCLDRLGRAPEAAREYRAARDLDVVHFRACDDENAVVREAAARGGDGVLLVDVERRLAEVSPDGIPGREFLTEHVHPLISGHDAIGRWICAALAESPIGSKLGTWDLSRLRTYEAYRERLGLAPVDDAAGLLLTLKYKLSKWPFTRACENGEASALLRREIAALRAGFDAPTASVFADLEAGRFADGFDYGHRHQEIARRALSGGDAPLAVVEFARAARYFGPNAELVVNQAQATLMAGRFAPAESLLDAATSLDPRLARTLFVRGMLRASQGRSAEAKELFRQYLQRESTGVFAQAARQSIQRLDRGLPVGVAGGGP
jgi:tetratricopeptide (TPR) repeat protein